MFALTVKACAASLLLSLSLSLSLSFSNTVFAQSSAGSPALLQGESRLQRLIEGAKKEGELNLYGSMPGEDMTPIIEAFTKKYGVKVKPWRSSGENVLQKIVTEAQGDRFSADVVEINSPQMEALHREKLLQPVRSPYHAELMSTAVPGHKEWVGMAVGVFVQAYNTTKVKKEELPKSYEDLLDPKWKGRLGVEADDHHWYATLVQALGQEKGTKLFKDIVDKNGMSVRKGHSLLANLVGSGEVPLGLTIYNYMPDQLKQKGAPVDSFIIPPAIGYLRGIGVLSKAPHPHAAVLFYDFMLSDEVQQLLAKRHIVPTSNKVSVPLKTMPLKLIDPAHNLDMNDKWIKEYEEAITKRAKQ